MSLRSSGGGIVIVHVNLFDGAVMPVPESPLYVMSAKTLKVPTKVSLTVVLLPVLDPLAPGVVGQV